LHLPSGVVLPASQEDISIGKRAHFYWGRAPPGLVLRDDAADGNESDGQGPGIDRLALFPALPAPRNHFGCTLFNIEQHPIRDWDIVNVALKILPSQRWRSTIQELGTQKIMGCTTVNQAERCRQREKPGKVEYASTD
jgi:hypothetical protein